MSENSQFLREDTWNDDKCTRIAFEDNFPAAVRNLNIQKKIINTFLNFYLGKRPPRGMSVHDLVYSTISIMPLNENTEKFIWDESHYKENGTLFYLSPDDKLKAEIQKLNLAEGASIENVAKDSIHSITKSEVNKGEMKMQDLDFNEDAIENETRTISENVNFQFESSLGDKEAFDNIEVENSKTFKELFAIRAEFTDAMNKLIMLKNNGHHSENQVNEDCQLKNEIHGENKEYFLSNKKHESKVPKLPKKLVWYNRRRNTQNSSEVKYRTFGPAENSAFIRSCNKLLENWDSYAEARTFLKYFFGIVALTLMRGVTKSYKHLVNTFSNENYIDKLPSTPLVTFQYMPPHKLCLKMSYRAFCKRGVPIRVMFAKLVVGNASLQLLKSKSILNHSLNPFLMAVLAHTSQYGMGLLALVDTIRRLVQIEDLNTLIEVTYCKETAESWSRVVQFAERHLVEPRPCLTVWWARLIEPDLFADLACPQNYPLAVILSTFITKLTQNSNLWRSKWVSGARNERTEELEKYKELGSVMYTNLYRK